MLHDENRIIPFVEHEFGGWLMGDGVLITAALWKKMQSISILCNESMAFWGWRGRAQLLRNLIRFWPKVCGAV